ncbi:MAG: DUF934 domain-containing protein [Rhodospirillaceae bacterium]|nr:DUF934 domain-containing protein [Rhodospirillaceae bacterium]
MPLLKNGAVAADPWRRLDDGALPPDAPPLLVALARWRSDPALAEYAGPLGLAVPNDADVRALGEKAKRFDLIALHFPKFTDGRAYTQARLLRERLGFAGELRATGQVLLDQLQFMQRCGFDAFEIGDDQPVAAWKRALHSFSVFYQPAADGSRAAATLRDRWRRA